MIEEYDIYFLKFFENLKSPKKSVKISKNSKIVFKIENVSSDNTNP